MFPQSSSRWSIYSRHHEAPPPNKKATPENCYLLLDQERNRKQTLQSSRVLSIRPRNLDPRLWLLPRALNEALFLSQLPQSLYQCLQLSRIDGLYDNKGDQLEVIETRDGFNEGSGFAGGEKAVDVTLLFHIDHGSNGLIQKV